MPGLRLEVRDTGIGLSQDAASRIFESFTQAEASTTRRFGGSGLGLAISKRLIEMMGGRIGVDSTPGQGSRFWFELPLPLAAASVEGADAALRFDGLRALAVDDIDANLEIIARQLRGFGMDVTCCNDPFDALALVERAWHQGAPFDIVFLDQMMAGLAGETVAQRIRRVPEIADTRLVLVSSAGGYGRDTETMKALDAAIDKPIRQRDLAACLARICGDAMPAAAESAPAASDGNNAQQGLRILLAEDNPINQKYMLALLGRAKHVIDIAQDGREAVAAAAAADYDVVLMDVQMPGLDGVQATRQIRAMPEPKRSVHIIALTAHAMSGAREQYIDAGMDDYVSKPIEAPILTAKLETIRRGLASGRRLATPAGLPNNGLKEKRAAV